MLEIPAHMWHQMREWSDMSTSASDPDLGCSPEEATQARMEMGTYGFPLACERKDKGGDDLISLLINQEVEGTRCRRWNSPRCSCNSRWPATRPRAA